MRETSNWNILTRWSALIGGVIWLLFVTFLHPNPFEREWAISLLLLSPLFLVPLALRLTISPDRQKLPSLPWRAAAVLQPLAAVLLVPAFSLPEGMAAALLAVPWWTVTALVALVGLHRFWQRGLFPLEELCIDAGLTYLVVGGTWTVLARLGARPLGFKDIIVLLTAIHFHYAGLALPLLTGFAGRAFPTAASRLGALGVIAGVPMVAAGITSTQLGLGSALECTAAWITAIAGSLTACLHLQLAMRRTDQTVWVRLLWVVSGVSLLGSMVLAAIYGSRTYFDVAWLDIPWMRALHGSANGLGFGLAGMLAWSLAKRSEG